MSVCVCFMCVNISACVYFNTSSSSWSLSLFSIHLLFFHPSFLSISVILFFLHRSLLLLACAARRPRVWFPIVGPAVSPLPYLLKMLPLLVSRGADDGALRRSFPPWEIPFHLLAGTLACPNLLTYLVHGAQVRVVHQLHEVPVPNLLVGGGRPATTAGV